MKILVTGGAGFIGSNIVLKLLCEDHEVVVVDNLSSGFEMNVDPRCCFINGDVRDTSCIDRSVQGCRLIFHLAASVGNARSIEKPIDDSTINLIGTLNILEAARRHGVKKVIFSSSAGVFGELKTLPIAEDHPQDPDSPYGTSKLAAEKMCLVYNKLYDMKNVCLRYFNVYGINQRYDAYGNVIPIFALRVLRNEPLTIFGDGEQTRDFVNVQDVAEANIRSGLTDGVAGVYNIGSGTRITINALAALVQKVAGNKVTIKHVPPRKGDVRHSLADISAARKAFNFNPQVEIQSGLTEYMKWLSRDPVTLKQIQGGSK
jgi:UDP-glucose 4-epimerase